MATKYIEKFDSADQLQAAAPDTGSARAIGVVSGQLCFSDGTNIVPVNKTALLSLTAGATLDAETHSNRTLVVNAAAGVALTLPDATGTGDKYRVVIGTLLTSGDVTVTAPSGSILKGIALINDIGDSTAATVDAYAAGTSDEIFTFDQSAGGGKVGDWLELEDVATGVYAVRAHLTGQVDPATPFTSA